MVINHELTCIKAKDKIEIIMKKGLFNKVEPCDLTGRYNYEFL